MKTVLLLGVGRSTHTLIKYLIHSIKILNIQIVLADQYDNDFLQPFIVKKQCQFVSLDINNSELRREYIMNSDVVISMLPPKFHFLVAKDCIQFSKHLITASYASDQIQKLIQALI